MSTRRLIIEIDGPSGAGKGTVAREIARRLDYKHLDTGAMYGPWPGKRCAIDCRSMNEDAVANLAQRAALNVGPSAVVIDGHEVTSEIRTPEIDRAATAAARLPKVRAVLVESSGSKARTAASSWRGAISDRSSFRTPT